MAIGWQQLLIVALLVLVLFGGRGKISALMGDFAQGLKAFRKGMQEDDEATDKAVGDGTASTMKAEPEKAPEAEKTSN